MRTTTGKCATTGSQSERAARAADERITGATGYAGFSMGAMFGLAIVADLPSVVSRGVRARWADDESATRTR